MASSFEFFGRAKKFFGAGDFSRALTEYDRCLKEDPKYEDAIINRAYTLLKVGGEFEALESVDKLIMINPKSSDAFMLRGQVNEILYDFKSAYRDYETVLKFNPYDRCAQLQMKFLPLKALRKVFDAGDEFKLLEKIKQNKKGVLPKILNERFEHLRRKKLEHDKSCNLKCKNVCCHFKEDMFRHGITINPHNLKAINEYLHSMNLNPKDYIESIEYSVGMGNRQKSARDFEDNKRYIYYPKRDMEGVKNYVDDEIPKKICGDRMYWAKDDAKPCGFLTENGCLIFGAKWEGGNGLKACRSYICQTGYIDTLLKEMGIEHVRIKDLMDFDQLSVFYEEYVKKLFKIFFMNDSGRIYPNKMKALKNLAEVKLSQQEESEHLGVYIDLCQEQEENIAEKMIVLQNNLT